MTLTPLGRVLRQRFRTPKDALRALGISPSLLNIRSMALDSAYQEFSGGDPAALRVKLEKLLAENLSGHELQKARELLEAHLGGGEYAAVNDEDNEDDDDDRAEQRRRTMAKIADFLATEKGLSEDQIEESLRDFPKNGLDSDLAEDLDNLMRDRRRRAAGDARRRQQAFDRRFPEAARLTGTSLETSYGVQPERRVAVDSAAAQRFADRWPEAMRIG